MPTVFTSAALHTRKQSVLKNIFSPYSALLRLLLGLSWKLFGDSWGDAGVFGEGWMGSARWEGTGHAFRVPWGEVTI